jgi:hypothetical protein
MNQASGDGASPATGMEFHLEQVKVIADGDGGDA